MERKIGEIFEFGGEWYQCVEGNDCANCVFIDYCKSHSKEERDSAIGLCVSFDRNDGMHVIFKKLEKVGEPYTTFVDKTVQNYLLETAVTVPPKDVFTLINNEQRLIAIEIKQTKEDMEEKEPTYEELLHYYHSTVGLWAIDRNPQEVDFYWICKNAFQLGIDKTLPNFEKIGKNLKPFNLEAAKLGKPVYTRDGRKARIVCFDRVDAKPILALVRSTDGKGEDVFDYFISGKRLANALESDLDLMMLLEKKEGWAKIRKDINLYDTKEEADRKMIGNDEYVTAKVCWEE